MSVAVLLATYNSERYLAELLDSLLNQTIRDFVCYVHDDGSTDRTMEIIHRYIGKFEHMVILDYPSTGSARANFMTMLQHIKEDYVMFCDHDDVWKPDKIEKSLDYIRMVEGNKPTLVFSDMEVVDENLDEICSSFMQFTGLDPERTSVSSLLVENVVPGCTSILNKKLYSIVRKCTSTDNIRMHDQWCALVAAATGKIIFLNDSTLLYRQHRDNVKGAGANRSLVDKIGCIYRRVISQSFYRENREWHELMGRQAHEIALLDEVPIETRELCEGFYRLKDCGKIRRICFYIKNRIQRKNDNLWLLMWC